jgi:perosamine synthetase
MIQLFKPDVGAEELKAIEGVLESGWLGLGPKTKEFEEKFAKYLDVEYVVGVNSCTSALDLSLKLLNINKGDEVIVPTMTFVSTGHVVAYNLATPVFADVDKDLLIDIEDVKRKITSRTKAIIPVHYSGTAVDIDELKEVVKHSGKEVAIIEDVAHACGSSLRGKKCGSLGDIACFSFHAVKNLCMGDGGAIVLQDKGMYERAKKLRWLGIDKGTWDRTRLDKSYWWEYDVNEIGLKCHMNDIAAAMGIEQLEKLDKMNGRRKEIAAKYTMSLKDVVKVPSIDDESSWHIYCIKCSDRNELSLWLREKEIVTGVHYKPIHLYRCYGNTPKLGNAERLFDKILSLPIHSLLTDDDVDYVIEGVKSFYAKRDESSAEAN